MLHMTWICLYSESIRNRSPNPKSAGCSSLLPQVKSPLLVLEMSQVLSGVNLSNFSGSVIRVWHCNSVIDLTL